MNFITGKDRHQLQFHSLDDRIAANNPVRFMDAFVDQIDLPKLGFVDKILKSEGRPAFTNQLMLKIYIYGYFNGIRSSRRLETECCRNIELQWLTANLQPNYHSIADFRKTNPSALKAVFKLFVLFLKDAGLVGANTVASDGTKIRAHNSKKKNYSQKKIDKHIAYIDERINEYLNQLDKNDASETPQLISNVQQKIDILKANKINYELLGKQLQESGDTQISTTDPDARALLVQGQVVEVGYNVQTAVDDKHKLVVATHTINTNDRNALFGIANEAKENLQVDKITTINDKGYHNGRQIQQCSDADITTIVAHQTLVNSNEDKGNGCTTPAYMVDKFQYNEADDTYTCPQGKTLHTKGTWHKKTRERDSYQFKKYRTPNCADCPAKHLCTGRQKGGREIERSEFAEAVEQNKKRYIDNKALYRTRQEINEHIFGTIKRKWGYNYTNLKGLEKVNGEMALIMTIYNMKRTLNILGFDNLMEKLKKWVPIYPNDKNKSKKGVKLIFFRLKNYSRILKAA
jgi:transposase